MNRLIATGCLLLAALPAGALMIAENRNAAVSIVLCEAPTLAEQTAAKELAAYLGAVTGGTFEIKSESQTSGQSGGIFVGPAEFAKTRGVDAGKLGPEDWVIRTLGKDLLLVGGRPRGSLYAVYRFLEDVIGVHFEGPVVELLHELKQEGLIKYTGLGGTTAYALARIMATGLYDVVLTAFNSSPLWREAMIAVLPEAQKQNMGVFLASPTQQGWLSRRFDKEIESGALFLSPPRRAQIKALYTTTRQLLVFLRRFPLHLLSVPWSFSSDPRPQTLDPLQTLNPEP